MKENIERVVTFNEFRDEYQVKIVCEINGKEIGFVRLTQTQPDAYMVGGLFVDQSERGNGISSELIKLVNSFLEKNKSQGKLLNTIKGDSAVVYENNGWVKGEYKSQNAYGAYEYLYDARG
jgi:GNAT superfamily N-acetyltransferase